MLLYFAVYIVIITGLLFFRSYEKDLLMKRKDCKKSLCCFYTFGLWIADHLCGKSKEKEEARKNMLRAVLVVGNVKDENRVFLAKKIAYVIIILLVFNTFGFVQLLQPQQAGSIKDGKYIDRPGFNQAAKDVNATVTVEQDGSYYEKEVSINVNAKKYSKKEFDAAVAYGKKYLKQVILGENKSFDHILKPLNLISYIPNTNLQIEWQLDTLVQSDGRLNNAEDTFKEAKKVQITATFQDGQYTKDEVIDMTIVPMEYTKEEKLWKEVQEAMSKKDIESATENKAELPDKVGGKKVYYHEDVEKPTVGLFLVYGVGMAILIAFLLERQLQQQVQKREVELIMDYPEVVDKLTLLLSAGITVKRAWQRIITEYEGKVKNDPSKKRYVYEEMKVTWNELENGISEIRAYENFGNRIGLTPYIKLITLITQNAKKGIGELTISMEREAISAFEDRKEAAKRLGEQASTKLLFPMIIMMVLVMVIVMMPAMQNM